jgi:hypothetical protein
MVLQSRLRRPRRYLSKLREPQSCCPCGQRRSEVFRTLFFGRRYSVPFGEVGELRSIGKRLRQSMGWRFSSRVFDWTKRTWTCGRIACIWRERKTLA